MIVIVLFVGLLNFALAGRYGIELGDLFAGSSKNNHGVRGNVSVVNENTFYIANFSYDGKAPDAYFWVGKTTQVSPNGFVVPDELGTDRPLRKYENKNVIISLPDNLKVSDIKWLSIWCRNFSADFGHVMIPDGFGEPKPKALPPLQQRAHKVRSGNIILLDSKTIQISSLYYDGNGPDAFFLVGTQGSPNGNNPIKVPDENGRLSRLHGYQGENIVLRLPDPYTWFDITWFAMYCIMAAQNFGEVYIHRPLNIPIDLSDLQRSQSSPVLTNCREIFRDQLLVRWKIIDEDIYINLEGRVGAKEYLSFGISGSEEAPQMVDADVVVAFYDDFKSTVVVDDYYLTAKTQCVGAEGSCPDTKQNGRNNIALVDWRYENGILFVTYKRRLQSTEEKDKAINIHETTTIVAAIGPVNSKMEAGKHKKATNDLIKINFGNDYQKCEPLKPIKKPKSTVKPWPTFKISNVNVFNARIGPSGADRGYTAITGIVGWGIAWWINGLLIPELTVIRGKNYTFVVEGGNDSSRSAEYHPFYITNSKEGGGVYDDNIGTPEHVVYAGVEINENGHFIPIGVGRYCEYKHKTVDRSAELETFEEFNKTLYLDCEPGDPGVFTWTPDHDTPNLLYYQCFTHRNLGWKIHVRNRGNDLFVFGKWILVIVICNVVIVLQNNLHRVR